MILDPYFYVVAVLSVFFHGMGKAGFGLGLPILAIPLMSLFIPPLQALAILVIPLIFMDLVTIKRFWKLWNIELIKSMIPLTFLGVIIGTITYSFLSDNSIRIILGIISCSFGIEYFINKNKEVSSSTKISGEIWSSLAGFTSFTIHAGGLPLSFYLLPMKLDRRIYVSTLAIVFLALNLFKTIPYAYFGQINFDNLLTSFLLLPLAPIGVYVGAYLTERVSQEIFYSITHFCLILTGSKLIYDGFTIVSI